LVGSYIALPLSRSQYEYLTPLSLACLLGIESWANDILKELDTCSLVVFSIGLFIRILMFWMPVEAQESQSMTALHFAAIGGWKATAKLLLDHGAAIDAKSWDGLTALHLTAAQNKDATARLLLDRNAEIDAEDWKGRTALHWATDKRCEAMVKLLLERGADIDHGDRDGMTPLHWAARAGYEATVELLLKSGADPNATAGKSQECRTALHYAASYRHASVVGILLEQGAEVNAKNSSGRTALHLAANSWSLAPNILQMKCALRANDLRNRRVPGQFEGVMEPSNDLELEELIGFVACLTPMTKTSLSWTTWGSMAIIRLLIEHKADIDIEDQWGKTALAKLVRNRKFVEREIEPVSIVSSTLGEIEWSVYGRDDWLKDIPLVTIMLGGNRLDSKSPSGKEG